MTTTRSKLTLLPGRFAILRLDPATPVPSWVWNGAFSSVSRTPSELSIVCEEGFVPQDEEADRGWCALVVAGPMDLSTVGVLASITGPLAVARVALFAVSTFETDTVLIKEETADLAVTALRDYGHIVIE